MSLRSIILLIAIMSFISLSTCITTVTEVDLDKYTGLWIQTYSSPFITHTFEKNGVCVAATYGINDDGSISVFNQLRISTYDGKLQTIEGSATIPDPSEPGKLTVNLNGGSLPGAPYWIVLLGPETYGEEGLYQYSVVTDPFELGLYVLVRDVDTFKSNFEADVLSFLESNGFTHFWNKPIATVQDNCEYVTSDQKTILAVAAPVINSNKQSIDTVDSLDISKYIGRWYQVYAGYFSFVATEKNGSCVAADYGIISTNNISVFNQEIAIDGTRSTITGFAYAPNASEPGQLFVNFPYSSGDYWIVKLGPDTYGDHQSYQYSIVTDESKFNLFVIARDVETFFNDYDVEVQTFLQSNGFNETWNTPILTNQQDCTYLDVTTTTNQHPKHLRGQ
jgi:apolipoprotein D and lipocalin family protein